MITLPSEIRTHISSYLELLDEYKLSQTCHMLYAKYCHNLFKKINTRLVNIFDDKLPELKKIMAETNSVISGSFIIQCLLGEEWKSDIDFFVSYQSDQIITKVDDFMLNTMSYDGSYVPAYSDIAGCERIKWTMDYYPHRRDDKNYSVLDSNIQIICIDVEKNYDAMRDHVVNYFDFDVCKNMYYYDGHDKLIVHNLEGILSRRTEFRFSNLGADRMNSNNIKSNISRYKKYVSRGFEFTNDINISMLDPIKLSGERLSKYDKMLGSDPYLRHCTPYQINGEELFDTGHLMSTFCTKCCIMKFFGIGTYRHLHFATDDKQHEFVHVFE